jgi:hypothetical protein
VHDCRSLVVTFQTLGNLAIVCNRSGGSRRPHVRGKSPKDLAFAVPRWARGCPWFAGHDFHEALFGQELFSAAMVSFKELSQACTYCKCRTLDVGIDRRVVV